MIAMRRALSQLLLLGTLGAGPAHAVTPKSTSGAAAEHATETTEDAKSKIVFLPIVARNEETSFQFGVAGIYLFPRAEDSAFRSSVTASTLVSVRKQFTASLGGNAYFMRDTLRLSGRLDAALWPTKFYSQNPPFDESEGYSYSGVKGDVTLGRKLWGNLFAGPSVRLSFQENDISKGGLMERSSLTALHGHATVGPGVSIALDSRDIAYAPSRGVFVGASAYYLFGLDARTRNTLESKLFARWYLSSDSARNVFAFALEHRSIEGDAPFSLLPTSDGTTVLRGMRKSRYYNRRLGTAQIEYRRTLGRLGPTGPWGFTLFAEGGKFYGDVGSDRLVLSLGGGVRYLVIPKERASLRVDVAYVDGGVGVVLNALEAF